MEDALTSATVQMGRKLEFRVKSRAHTAKGQCLMVSPSIYGVSVDLKGNSTAFKNENCTVSTSELQWNYQIRVHTLWRQAPSKRQRNTMPKRKQSRQNVHECHHEQTDIDGLHIPQWPIIIFHPRWRLKHRLHKTNQIKGNLKKSRRRPNAARLSRHHSQSPSPQ